MKTDKKGVSRVVAAKITPAIETRIEEIRDIYAKTAVFKMPPLPISAIVEMGIESLWADMLKGYEQQTGFAYRTNIGSVIIKESIKNEPELPFKEYEPQSSTEAFTDALIDHIEEQQQITSVKVQPIVREAQPVEIPKLVVDSVNEFVEKNDGKPRRKKPTLKNGGEK